MSTATEAPEVLPLEFPRTRRGVTYTLEADLGDAYVVRGSLGEASWFEAFERRVASDRTISGMFVQAHVLFPGDEAFGRWAWCTRSLPLAEAKAGAFRARVRARNNLIPQANLKESSDA